MKTKLQIIGIALLGFFLTSCSSSMYMSKTSGSSTDDIYYTPNKTSSTLTDSDKLSTLKDQNQEPEKMSINQLENKYSELISSSDSASIDTLIYKAESTNPFERILSDSYQESYERRLRGMEDPRYKVESPSVFYSDDYFWASAYDPAFYRVVVMGDQVWVEPNYVSSMFTWPHTNFWFGFGIGFGFNSWYYNRFYSPYYGNNYWMGYDPYYYGYGYNSNTANNYNYFGKRSGIATNLTSLNRGSATSYENQFVSSRRRNGTATESTVNSNPRTRNSNQTDIITRNTDKEVIGARNRNINSNTTRLREETSTRKINTTEPTRKNNNNYQRPRSTSNDGYIRTGTRNQNINTNSTTRDNNTRNTTTTIRDNRNSTNTYNRPNRVSTATTKSERSTTSSGSTVRESSSPRTTVRESSSGSSSPTRSNTNSGSSTQSSSSSRKR